MRLSSCSIRSHAGHPQFGFHSPRIAFLPGRRFLLWGALCLPLPHLLGNPGMMMVETPAALREVVRKASPGDQVVVANGIWRDARIVLEGKGKPGSPITIRAQTPGGLVLSGQSSLEVNGSHLVIEGFHFRDGWLESDHVVHLRGTDNTLRETLIDHYNPPDRETRYFWVSLSGSRHLVERSTFRGMNHSGVTLVVWRPDDSPDHHIIRRNHFVDRPEGTGNGWEMIRIGTSHQCLSDSHTLVEENLFERCDGEIEIISNKSGRNIYRRNTFRASRGTLTLRHGDHCVVDSNFFFGEGINGTGGIRVIGEGHRVTNNHIEGTRGRGVAAIALSTGIPDGPLTGYTAAHRALVAFNTITGVTGPHLHLSAGHASGRDILAEGVVIANNLLHSGENRSGVLVDGRPGPGLRVEGNIGHGRPAGSLPEIKEADPLLETGVGGILQPSSHSPAIHAATGAHPLVQHDIFGRPRGTDKTVGCVEPSRQPPIHLPLRPGDAGAKWVPVN